MDCEGKIKRNQTIAAAPVIQPRDPCSGPNPSVVCANNQAAQPTSSQLPTVTTVSIGGVNPARAPGVQDDDGAPTISNINGSFAIGIPTIWGIIKNLQGPSNSADASVYLSYTTLTNGSINDMVITLQNHSGGSSVDLNGVIIESGYPPSKVYLRPTHNLVVNPGQIKSATICGNCIGANTLSSNTMPINNRLQVNITTMIGAFYDFGSSGTNYGSLPVSYTIPSR